MEKGNIWIIVAVAIVVAVLSSLITLGVTGNVTGNAVFSNNVKANSCDADSICEVQGTISSGNALKLSSNSLI